MDVDLRLGDCLDLMRGMEAGSVDAVITSPPYDNLRDYGKHSWDFEGVARELFRVVKVGGVVVWVFGDATIDGSETGTSFRQALYFMERGFKLYDTMIYEKAGGLVVGNVFSYRQSFEYMFVLSKGKPAKINLLADKNNLVAGKRTGVIGTRRPDGSFKNKPALFVKECVVRNNVWRIHAGNNGDDRTEHPAVFPEALARDHILSWTNEGDTVLDCFMGSGTTGKMCVKLNRNFIGCEIHPPYFAIAQKRIAEAQLQIPLLMPL